MSEDTCRSSSTTPIPSPSEAPARNHGAAVWLVAALAAILLAGLLDTGSERQVLLPWLLWPLPETCTLRLQLGVDCPGCGLTRGFIHAAHGRLREALAVHALSLPLFVVVLLQLPLALAHWIPIRNRWLQIATRCNTICLIVLAALLLVRWIWLLASGQLLG